MGPAGPAVQAKYRALFGFAETLEEDPVAHNFGVAFGVSVNFYARVYLTQKRIPAMPKSESPLNALFSSNLKILITKKKDAISLAEGFC